MAFCEARRSSQHATGVAGVAKRPRRGWRRPNTCPRATRRDGTHDACLIGGMSCLPAKGEERRLANGVPVVFEPGTGERAGGRRRRTTYRATRIPTKNSRSAAGW
jgi:hypothetical protein